MPHVLPFQDTGNPEYFIWTKMFVSWRPLTFRIHGIFPQLLNCIDIVNKILGRILFLYGLPQTKTYENKKRTEFSGFSEARECLLHGACDIGELLLWMQSRFGGISSRCMCGCAATTHARLWGGSYVYAYNKGNGHCTFHEPLTMIPMDLPHGSSDSRSWRKHVCDSGLRISLDHGYMALQDMNFTSTSSVLLDRYDFVLFAPYES